MYVKTESNSELEFVYSHIYCTDYRFPITVRLSRKWIVRFYVHKFPGNCYYNDTLLSRVCVLCLVPSSWVAREEDQREAIVHRVVHTTLVAISTNTYTWVVAWRLCRHIYCIGTEPVLEGCTTSAMRWVWRSWTSFYCNGVTIKYVGTKKAHDLSSIGTDLLVICLAKRKSMVYDDRHSKCLYRPTYSFMLSSANSDSQVRLYQAGMKVLS